MSKQRCRQDERKYEGKRRNRMREVRKRKGLTQTTAAKLAGYASKSGWAMVELVYAIPSAEQMGRIADVLGCTADYLFGEIEEAIQ